jgi:hypothetical protein
MSERVSTTQAIANAVGGSWRYNRQSRQWQCSDGSVAHWVWSCFSYCDEDNCGHPPELWLYGRGTPQRLVLAQPQEQER